MSEFVLVAVKACLRCKEDRPFDDFGVNRSRRDGRHVYCRSCCREQNYQSYLKRTGEAHEQRDDLRELKGIPGYFCSEDGNVFRRLKSAACLGLMVFTRLECPPGADGRRRLLAMVGGKATAFLVGREVARAWMPSASGRHVHHRDGNRANDSLGNLVWCAGLCPVSQEKAPLTKKVCRVCSVEKDGVEFPSGKRRCRECLGRKYAALRTEEKKQRDRDVARARRESDRVAVFDHYGWSCACCGFDEREFLTMDHVNNDGADHRRSIGGTDIYRWLVRNGFPSGFQTLCANCQLGKLKFGGVCPHQARGLAKAA